MAIEIQGTWPCPICRVMHPVIFPGTQAELNACVEKYKRGALIQDAFSILSKSDREILLTGTCNDAWDKITKE